MDKRGSRIIKISKMKEVMGYETFGKQPACNTCMMFEFKEVPFQYYPGHVAMMQTELRCSIGGFAVKPRGVCKLYQRKEVANG